MQRSEAEHVLLAAAANAREQSLRERAAMLDADKYPHLTAWIERRALEAKAPSP